MAAQVGAEEENKNCDTTTARATKESNLIILFVTTIIAITLVPIESACALSDDPAASGAYANATTAIIEQPQDTYAIYGQAVNLDCVVANKTERQKVSWRENDDLAASELWPSTSKEVKQLRTMHNWQSDPALTNYVFFHKRVTLNGNKYRCVVTEGSPPTKLYESREASVIVVKAPERFEILATNADSGSEDGSVRVAGAGADSAEALDDADTPPQEADWSRKVESTYGSDWPGGGGSDDQLLANLTAPRAADDNELGNGGSSGHRSKSAQRQQPGNNDNNIYAERVVHVRHNTSLRLECLAESGRPYAKLLWLDHRHRIVPLISSNVAPPENQLGDDRAMQKPHLANYTAREFVSVSPDDKLSETVSLVWTFQVDRSQHNQVLTCAARHKAWQLMKNDETDRTDSDDFSGDGADSEYANQLVRLLQKPDDPDGPANATELRWRRVRLAVQYEPEIQLTREPAQLIENRAVKFHCRAHARPAPIEYKWFIDDEPVAGATEPELRILAVSRQLNQREVKCVVRNEVGSTWALMPLTVHYAPAFVTHLLPASLRPPEMQSDYLFSGSINNKNNMDIGLPHQPANIQQLGWRAPAVSRQLAMGYDLGQQVQLRCDFDAYPRAQSVSWFKINTDYRVMANVTPAEADELIAGGAVHALFKGPSAAAMSTLTPRLQPLQLALQQQPSKRHIVSGEMFAIPGAGSDWPATEPELDYELMSAELLDELSQLERIDHSEAAQHNSDLRVLERLTASAPAQTTAPISEQLGWHLVPYIERRVPLPARKSAMDSPTGSTGNSSASPTTPAATGSASKALSLSRDPMLLSEAAATRLGHRQAVLTSSYITLTQANEDSMGKYVCVAKTLTGPGVAEEHSASAGTTGTIAQQQAARAFYVVMRQSPRIVSNSQQTAVLSASQVQVECLAQISTVQDNLTSFTWSKEFKLIDVQPTTQHQQQQQQQQVSAAQSESADNSANKRRAGNNNKVVTIIEQRSPDLLFVRSILRISGADLSDFGQYNCTIRNSFGQDSMIVHLQPTAPTGFYFIAMASLTLGAILVFVCATGAAIIPCNRLDSVAKAAALAGERAASLGIKRRNQPTGAVNYQSNGSAVDGGSNIKGFGSGHVNSGAANGTDESTASQGESAGMSSCDHQSVATAEHSPNSSGSAASSMVITGSVAGVHNQVDVCAAYPYSYDRYAIAANHQSHDPMTGEPHHQLQQLHRPESALAVPMHSRQALQRGSSLRCPNGYGPSGGGSRCDKFAAIHENLESKLQFGNSQTTTEPPRANAKALSTCRLSTGGGDCASEATTVEMSRLEWAAEQDAAATDTTKTVRSTASAGRSLFDRLRLALLMKPQEQQSGSVRQTKRSKPTISGPISQSLRRCSLSNSLGALANGMKQSSHVQIQKTTATAVAAAAAAALPKNLNDGNNHQHHHDRLVSSSANLIQDSTTASSGRSSSQSGVGGAGNGSASSSYEPQQHQPPPRPPPLPPQVHHQHQVQQHQVQQHLYQQMQYPSQMQLLYQQTAAVWAAEQPHHQLHDYAGGQMQMDSTGADDGTGPPRRMHLYDPTTLNDYGYDDFAGCCDTSNHISPLLNGNHISQHNMLVTSLDGSCSDTKTTTATDHNSTNHLRASGAACCLATHV